MEVSYTYDPRTPDHKTDYMVVASAAEWKVILSDLNFAWMDGGVNPEAKELIEQFESWGITP